MTNPRTDRTERLPLRDVFRRRLRQTRRARDLTQADLAARVTDQGGAMTQTTVTRLERGSRAVTVDELFSLAYALDVTPLALLLPLDQDVSLRVDRRIVSVRQFVDWVVGREPLGGWGEEPEAVSAYERLLPRVLQELRAAESAVEMRVRQAGTAHLTDQQREEWNTAAAEADQRAVDLLRDRWRRRQLEWWAGSTEQQRRAVRQEYGVEQMPWEEES